MLKELHLNELKNRGYKLTAKRRVVVEVLQDTRGKFLSVEQIYSLARQKDNNINLSTIYRNLELLYVQDLIHKIVSVDEKTLYGLIDVHEHHHHIICTSCGNTSVIDYCPGDNYEKIALELGYKLTDHKIELYGLCKDCV